MRKKLILRFILPIWMVCAIAWCARGGKGGIGQKEAKNYDNVCKSGIEFGKNASEVKTADEECGLRVYEPFMESVDEEYADFAREVLGKTEKYDICVRNYEGVIGSAEKTLEDNGEWNYMCDLDNDGELEYYNKEIWTSDNTYAVDCLSFYSNLDEGVDLLHRIIREQNGQAGRYNAIMLWADEVENKNVVSVMYRTGEDTYSVIGYLVEGTDFSKVYQISYGENYKAEE